MKENNNWKCECGYDNMDQINNKLLQLKKDNSIHTTFFPIRKFLPNYLKEKYIQAKLLEIPDVEIIDQNVK